MEFARQIRELRNERRGLVFGIVAPDSLVESLRCPAIFGAAKSFRLPDEKLVLPRTKSVENIAADSRPRFVARLRLTAMDLERFTDGNYRLARSRRQLDRFITVLTRNDSWGPFPRDVNTILWMHEDDDLRVSDRGRVSSASVSILTNVQIFAI